MTETVSHAGARATQAGSPVDVRGGLTAFRTVRTIIIVEAGPLLGTRQFDMGNSGLHTSLDTSEYLDVIRGDKREGACLEG